MLNVWFILTLLPIKTININNVAIIFTPITILFTSFNPVCLIPLWEPIIKKDMVEIRAIIGNCANKIEPLKLGSKLNLIKYETVNVISTKAISIAKTNHFEEWFINIFFIYSL